MRTLIVSSLEIRGLRSVHSDIVRMQEMDSYRPCKQGGYNQKYIRALKEIALYVGSYEGYFPELLKPKDESMVIPGQIPTPGALGSVSRRMMSVQDMSDKTAIRNWNLVEFSDRFVTKELMILGVSVGQVEGVSLGQENPAMAGVSEEAFARNRRAEIAYK